MNFKNSKHVTSFKCGCCDETREIIYDEIHGEVICLNCGLVLSTIAVNFVKKVNG